MEDGLLVLPNPNRCRWGVWHHDALVAGYCAERVLALARSDSYLANVRRLVFGDMSCDWVGIFAD